MFTGGGKAGKVGSELLPARAWHIFPCLTTAFCQRCQSFPAGSRPARQGGSPRPEAHVASTSCHPASRGLQAGREPHVRAVVGFARTFRHWQDPYLAAGRVSVSLGRVLGLSAGAESSGGPVRMSGKRRSGQSQKLKPTVRVAATYLTSGGGEAAQGPGGSVSCSRTEAREGGG